jgi:hypothetical protein
MDSFFPKIGMESQCLNRINQRLVTSSPTFKRYVKERGHVKRGKRPLARPQCGLCSGRAEHILFAGGSFTPVQSAFRPLLSQILFATSQVAQIPSGSNVTTAIRIEMTSMSCRNCTGRRRCYWTGMLERDPTHKASIHPATGSEVNGGGVGWL